MILIIYVIISSDYKMNKDTTIIILNKLDDKDLTSMRLVSKYFNNIISEDMFWLKRIISLHNIPTDILIRYKKDSWYKYYIYDIRQYNYHDQVDNFYHLMSSVENGRLDLMIMSLKPNEDLNFIKLLINKASAYGYIDIVKYLIEKVLKTKEFKTFKRVRRKMTKPINFLQRIFIRLSKYFNN